MLRNICYTLMAGCVISSVWKMQSHSRLFVPGIEPDAGLEMSETSDTEQMDDLLTWVGMIEKASGLHSDDQAELFRPYLTPDFGKPDILKQLEPGMSREEVRSLLGDPIGDTQYDKLWTYQTARIMFEKNRMQGWVEIDVNRSLEASIARIESWSEVSGRNQESGNERRRLSNPAAKRNPIIRSRVASQGSARRKSNYRSSVDRIYQAINRTKRTESRMYHKPQYLSNMFRSRDALRRERQRRVGRHNNRVQSYRRISG